MTSLVPLELLDQEDRPGFQIEASGARASGTPFVSFFAPADMLVLACDAAIRSARHVPISDMAERYFADRTDGLRPSSGEDLLVATT